jgi:hypothetical protein
MNKDQVKGRVEETKGKVKEVTGKIIDDKGLEVEGKYEKQLTRRPVGFLLGINVGWLAVQITG